MGIHEHLSARCVPILLSANRCGVVCCGASGALCATVRPAPTMLQKSARDTDVAITIERLDAAAAARELPALCGLVQDAVADGAALGFLPPLGDAEVQHYWQGVVADVAAATQIVLVARVDGTIAGSVQLALATKANGRHRAEVQKLCVLRAFRHQGIGQRLMQAVDDVARASGRTLLVLDTRQGDTAERLYQRVGYTAAGVVPSFARSADGSLHATVIFYRLLDTPSSAAGVSQP